MNIECVLNPLLYGFLVKIYIDDRQLEKKARLFMWPFPYAK